MFQSLEVFQVASAMAKHAGKRQAYIAQNVANADTPGYIARDISSFQSTLQSQTDVNLRATRQRHLHGTRSTDAPGEVYSDKTHASPDGNTVSVEREILKAVETKRQHDRALAIYKSALDVLRMSLSRQ